VINKKLKKKLRGFYFARELYRPSDRRFVGEVSANFCGYRLSRGQRNGSLLLLISVFKTGAATFSFK
jgi:hypothetical protein